jgi:membrane protease YdiL (CAAX protease family)
MGVPLGAGLQIPIVLAYSAIHRIFPGFDPERASGPIERFLAEAPTTARVGLIVIAVAAAPVAEELFFRGLLLRVVENAAGSKVAIGATAVLFGLAHWNLVAFPAFVFLGVVFGLMVVRTRSLALPIAAHVGFNAAAALTIVVFMGQG